MTLLPEGEVENMRHTKNPAEPLLFLLAFAVGGTNSLSAGSRQNSNAPRNIHQQQTKRGHKHQAWMSLQATKMDKQP